VALGKILSAFGKLGIVALIAVAFAFGLLVTVYLSLRSPNIQVPDVVAKTYFDGEKVLGQVGLDIRERAKRYKPDVQPGIILDQSPRPGEVVKAGQTIAVVVSRAPKDGEKPPDEGVAEERREERGTEGLDQNRNQNANRRKNTNRNANGNANSNAAANRNANGNGEAGNANARNANSGNTSVPGNRNANSTTSRNGNANISGNRNRSTSNANSGSRTGATGRSANANRRPNP
jgi:beta-lactam-binding protein with PASTA domain